MYECWAHYWHTVTDYWPWLSVPLSFVYGQLELVLNVEYISMAITLYNLHMAWVIHPLDKFKRIETQFISAFSLLLFRWKKRVTFAGLWVWRCIKDVLTHWTWNKSECVKFKPQFCVTIRMTWKDTSFRSLLAPAYCIKSQFYAMWTLIFLDFFFFLKVGRHRQPSLKLLTKKWRFNFVSSNWLRLLQCRGLTENNSQLDLNYFFDVLTSEI